MAFSNSAEFMPNFLTRGLSSHTVNLLKHFLHISFHPRCRPRFQIHQWLWLAHQRKFQVSNFSVSIGLHKHLTTAPSAANGAHFNLQLNQLHVLCVWEERGVIPVNSSETRRKVRPFPGSSLHGEIKAATSEKGGKMSRMRLVSQIGEQHLCLPQPLLSFCNVTPWTMRVIDRRSTGTFQGKERRIQHHGDKYRCMVQT